MCSTDFKFVVVFFPKDSLNLHAFGWSQFWTQVHSLQSSDISPLKTLICKLIYNELIEIQLAKEFFLLQWF